MPAWTNDPVNAIQSLTPGVPAYSAGSLRKGPVGRFIITQTAVATNVVTLTGSLVEGYIPSIGDLIFVHATARDAGGLNTSTGIAIASVTIAAATGIGTITYAKTASDLATAADPGYAEILPAEIAETLNFSTAYQAFAVPHNVAGVGANPSFTLTVSFPSAPGAIKASLQGAMRNVDAEFVNLIKDVTAAGTYSDSGAPAQEAATGQFWPGAWNFVRYADTGSSGGSSPTVIAKITMSN
jgi:hypothetical protein